MHMSPLPLHMAAGREQLQSGDGDDLGSDSVEFNGYATGGWKAKYDGGGECDLAQRPSQLEGCEVGNNGSSTLEESDARST